MLVTATLALTACGQKGPLYLPADETASTTMPETAEQNQDAKADTKPAAE